MSVKNSETLKQLKSRKAKLEAELQFLADERSSAMSKYDKAKNQIKQIETEIDQLTKSEPVVTEHAIIRYMERVRNYDIEILENEILTDDLKTQIKTLGNGKYPIGNGFRAVVKDNSIVSIV